MAKQSKSVRADSSAGGGAAAVSGNTDTVAAAAPATPSAHTVAADDRAALLSVVKSMYDDVPGIIAALEGEARASAQDRDHARHSLFARVAMVFGEFRNGLATILNAPQV